MSPCCPIAPSTRHYSSQPHFSQSQYIKIWFSIYTRRHFVWLCCGGGITTNNVICHTFKLNDRTGDGEVGKHNYLLHRVMMNILPSRCGVPRFILMMLFGCSKCQFIKFSCFKISTLMRLHNQRDAAYYAYVQANYTMIDNQHSYKWCGCLLRCNPMPCRGRMSRCKA